VGDRIANASRIGALWAPASAFRPGDRRTRPPTGHSRSEPGRFRAGVPTRARLRYNRARDGEDHLLAWRRRGRSSHAIAGGLHALGPWALSAYLGLGLLAKVGVGLGVVLLACGHVWSWEAAQSGKGYDPFKHLFYAVAAVLIALSETPVSWFYGVCQDALAGWQRRRSRVRSAWFAPPRLPGPDQPQAGQR
jgi:hypothetical protein